MNLSSPELRKMELEGSENGASQNANRVFMHEETRNDCEATNHIRPRNLGPFSVSF